MAPLLSPVELAALLSVTRKSIYNQVARKQIPAEAIVYIGRRLRFRAEHIERWLGTRTHAQQLDAFDAWRAEVRAGQP